MRTLKPIEVNFGGKMGGKVKQVTTEEFAERVDISECRSFLT